VLNVPKTDKFYRVVGPCFAEYYDLLLNVGRESKACGVEFLRGGTVKAGTYPPAQEIGLQERNLQLLAHVAKELEMKAVTEVLDVRDLDFVCRYADVIQIGARHMQDYALLNEAAKMGKTVFLKRNMGATLDEFLGAAEYIAKRRNDFVLIERGSSTHCNHVRWDLSISMIAAIKKMCNAPVIVDASHGTGRRDLVESMTFAGVAAGADGFLIEAHTCPEKSASDADQAIDVRDVRSIVKKCDKIRSIVMEG
jgi:3-deoxy-7-phosphoheptulonate synthase